MRKLSKILVVLLAMSSVTAFAKNNLDANPVGSLPSEEARISFPATKVINNITRLTSGEWYRIEIGNKVPLTSLSVTARKGMVMASNAVITTVNGDRFYISSFQRAGIIPVDSMFHAGTFDTIDGVAHIDIQLQALENHADVEVGMSSSKATPEFLVNL